MSAPIYDKYEPVAQETLQTKLVQEALPTTHICLHQYMMTTEPVAQESLQEKSCSRVSTKKSCSRGSTNKTVIWEALPTTHIYIYPIYG